MRSVLVSFGLLMLSVLFSPLSGEAVDWISIKPALEESTSMTVYTNALNATKAI